MSMLDNAIQAIRMGNREEGRRLLEEMLENDENNEQIWFWLTSAVDTDEDREVCLENVLALNPHHSAAQRGLEALRRGTFNVQDMMSQALEEEDIELEQPGSGRTFLDEFELSAGGDDLVMPSSMGGASARAKPAPARSGKRKLNMRLLLLVAFVLLILFGLAAAAAFSLLVGDGEGEEVATPEPPGQVAPGGGEEPAPQATETPIPTDTPTLTPTPDLSLPTPRPTEPATPTATMVVPPTPG
jgi:hypothetical protein